MATRFGDAAQRAEPREALGIGQVVVAIDEPRSARQTGERTLQPRIVARVGDQPQAGKGLYLRHRVFIARSMDNAATRLAEVHANIARVCKPARRKPEDVTLIAVSKTHDAPTIQPLIDAGQRVFGENRVQEAQGKWPALKAAHPDIELHLIGQLQSNKAEEAVALFDVIHSLDRPSLLTALAKAMDKAGRQVPCFVQVNIGDEPQKGGCPIAELPAFLDAVRAANVPLAGLMCIPPADTEAAPFFAFLAKLASDHGLEGLSMGMSGDYETAVMLGATHVRVGTALFGARG